MRQIGEVDENIERFVLSILKTSNGRVISPKWRAELKKYSDLSISSQKNYVTKYRSAIQAAHIAATQKDNPDLNPKDIPDHPALRFVKIHKDLQRKFTSDYRIGVATENENLIYFPQWKKAMKVAETLIERDAHAMIAMGLALATGRRTFEIYTTAEFKPYRFPGEKKAAPNMILFKGQAKMKGSKDIRGDNYYPIPTIISSTKVLKTYKRLRELAPQYVGITNPSFNNKLGKRLPQVVVQAYTPIWPSDEDPVPKNLRALYAEIAYKIFPELHEGAITKPAFFARILGHAENDIETSLTYFDYALTKKSKAQEVRSKWQGHMVNLMHDRENEIADISQIKPKPPTPAKKKKS